VLNISNSDTKIISTKKGRSTKDYMQVKSNLKEKVHIRKGYPIENSNSIA
jgi:hypothetical protein